MNGKKDLFLSLQHPFFVLWDKFSLGGYNKQRSLFYIRFHKGNCLR